MKVFLLVGIAFGLVGCSSFKLGTMLYCPHGQGCVLMVAPPGETATVPAKAGAKEAKL